MLTKPPNQQAGVVLVTALLYLLVITLLVVCAFSTSILQTKLSQQLSNQAQAFENTEAALLTGEQAIQTDQTAGEGVIDSNSSYHYQRISRPECGLFYQVDANGKSATAKAHLQSVFVFPMAPPTPCWALSPKPHRAGWLQLDS